MLKTIFLSVLVFVLTLFVATTVLAQTTGTTGPTGVTGVTGVTGLTGATEQSETDTTRVLPFSAPSTGRGV